MTKRTEKIKAMKCPECDMSVDHKLSCDSKDSFEAFKKCLIWLPYMTDRQLAELNFSVWVEAQERSGRQIEDEIKSAFE